jgi:hypothetical protein
MSRKRLCSKDDCALYFRPFLGFACVAELAPAQLNRNKGKPYPD